MLTDELRKILVSLNTAGSGVVSPDSLLTIIWDIMPRFRGYQQQDAHEFLRYMLDRVHTELIHLIPQFAWDGLNCNGKRKMSELRQNGSSGFNEKSSIVTCVFGGTLLNEVRNQRFFQCFNKAFIVHIIF